MKFGSRINTLLRIAPWTLLTLVYAGEAHAADPVLTIPCTDFPGTWTYNLEAGTAIGAPAPFIGRTPSVTVAWLGTPTATDGCTGSGINWTCAGMAVTLPTTASTTQEVSIAIPGATTTLPAAAAKKLIIKATSTDTSVTGSCEDTFTFQVTTAASGWGDPHLTTVDGVHYDFQSAGEFTALRDNEFVIQTRQGPVPTATVPITNAYTGITHCVAIYTAVAAKLGSTRVTVQPSPGPEPDPSAMQLRVNGKLVQLGEAPLILKAEGDKVDGTLTKHRDGNIEITDARGTQLVVTPSYWASQKVWYVNVNVYGTSANQGTMGSIAAGSWLPALPDGSSVGPRPDAEAERYQVLYEKFADAWRVTDATSLFDYEPGTNTATFTRDEWPRNHPQSCAIGGQTSAPAVTEQVAQQACVNVTHATQKADCVFDVMITGNAGFAKTYETMRGFGRRPPGWYTPVKVDPPPPCKECPKIPPPCPPAQPWWCCWFVIVLGILQLILLVFLVRRALSKKP